MEQIRLEDLVGNDPDHRRHALQISMEHRSVELYDQFSLGVIEISDEGAVNLSQKQQVMDMVREETRDGGLLVVFVHGWHHGARTCDRDIACFRAVLNQMKRVRVRDQGKVVGVFIGWRGESLAREKINVATLWQRKRIAQHIGRTAGKEILLELEGIWERNEKDLTMITVGHSLGGAFVFSAVKQQLTGNVSDIEWAKVRTYRVVRAEGNRVEALDRGVKALRAGFGDLVVLVNPAIEAAEYEMFDEDLEDLGAPRDRGILVENRMPYDKIDRYDRRQLPVLMTVAATADTAVGLFFPPARALQGLFTGHWEFLVSKSQLQGMGRYTPHVTHTLSYPAGTREAEEGTVAPDCGCSKITDAEVNIQGNLQLDTREVQHLGDLTFAPTPERLKRGWDVNSPYLVVQANAGVISEHNDIFNPVLVRFLGKYINAYTAKYEKYDVARDIGEIDVVDTQFHGVPARFTPERPPGRSPSEPLSTRRLRLVHSDYIGAWQALFGYTQEEVEADHVREEIRLRTAESQGAAYPNWILDRTGVGIALVDEPQFGKELDRSRFRWIAPADALLAPFGSDQTIPALAAEVTLPWPPKSVTDYAERYVSAILGRWKTDGAVAIKLFIPHDLPSDPVTLEDAERIFRRLAAERELSISDRQALRAFLFRQIAAKAGQAKLVVHVQPVSQMPPFSVPTGANPRRLISVFEDPALQNTRFVLVQGGSPFELEIEELLAKPNVYVELSLSTLLYPVHKRTLILRNWLTNHSDKIVFGSDASADSAVPLGGWEARQWLLTKAARESLAAVLGILVEEEKITRQRALELAAMVLRGNALQLYGLGGSTARSAGAIDSLPEESAKREERNSGPVPIP
jgi:uncharacterized protein